VQHRQRLSRGWGRAHGDILLPDLSVPATHAGIELRYPAQWTPIWQAYAHERRMLSPTAGDLFLALVLLLWSERVLALLGFSGRRRFVLALLFASATLAAEWIAGTLFVADVAGTGLWIWAVIQGKRKGGVKFALAVIAAGLTGMIILVSLFSLRASKAQDTWSSSNRSYDNSNALPTQNFQKSALNNPTAPQPVAAGPAYQGLPAKFEMPWGATRERFDREMLKTGEAVPVKLVLLSRAGVFWSQALVALLALIVALTGLRKGLAGVRELLEPAPAKEAPAKPA